MIVDPSSLDEKKLGYGALSGRRGNGDLLTVLGIGMSTKFSSYLTWKYLFFTRFKAFHGRSGF